MAERRDVDGLVVRHAVASDLDAINRIYNHEVLHGTATWDEDPWSVEQRRAWFEQHDQSTPVLIAEVAGSVVGFAYLSHYRPKAGYRFTRENTVYVEEGYRGRGVGRRLLEALLDEARRDGVHAVIAVIEAENAVSIRLHERLGFELIGTGREVDFKFGRWLDSVYMELLLGSGDR